MADIIGSRAATGQSAARFSVRAIQNELPLIGLSGTPDSASYLTKMQTIGRQIRVGLNAMPDNGRAMAWLNRREADIAKQKGSTGSVASALGGKGKVSLRAAMALPQNKGKTEQQVEQDIQARGYEVTRP